MTSQNTAGFNLEDVMFRLLDYQSGNNTGHVDTMVMISLVNLLGIISVMNKMASPAAALSSSPGEDPLISGLLKSLGQGQGPPMARGGGPGISPELLLGLLGSRGQRPENALLLALLSSLMQPGPPPPGHPAPPRQRQSQAEKEMPEAPQADPDGETPSAGGARNESRRPRGTMPWDRRLG